MFTTEKQFVVLDFVADKVTQLLPPEARYVATVNAAEKPGHKAYCLVQGFCGGYGEDNVGGEGYESFHINQRVKILETFRLTMLNEDNFGVQLRLIDRGDGTMRNITSP